jgi:DNA-binding IclR family transcriptional regulator
MRSLTGPLRRYAVVIDAVASSRHGLETAQIAGLTGLPLPTAHRITRALVGIGYLDRDGWGAPYRLGPRLLGLFQKGLSQERLHPIVAPVMKPIAERLDATAFLCQLVDGDIRTAIQFTPSQPKNTVLTPGSDLPLHAASSGKIFLAAMDEEELARALPARLKRFRPATIISRAQLQRELARVRTRGFATCEDEFLEGVYSLSCPVLISGRRIPLALGVEGFKETLLRKTDPSRLLESIRKAANAIAPELAGLLPPD